MVCEGFLPENVTIVDVCMRDGLQNVQDFVPTYQKEQIIDGLVKAGVRRLEITSFVNPKVIPQLADSASIAKTVREKYPEINAIALVPNLRGAEFAVENGIQEITCVISASESHNKANVNRSIEKSFEDLKMICRVEANISVRLSLATAFVCPFDGLTPIERAIGLAERALELGVKEIIFCDTIGAANPIHVAQLSAEAKKRWPGMRIGLHLHNTRGLGLANTFSAMLHGINIFEASAGGLGGCPFAPGASGNTATEDMVNMLDEMRINSGVSLAELLQVTRYISKNVNAKLSSSMFLANKEGSICF
jgi:hydroxymethylglutaryl-CoA lyase